MKNSKIIFVSIVVLFSVIACQTEKKEESLQEFLEKRIAWINTYETHYYLSNKNDTLSFKIVDVKEESGNGGSSVGAPDWYLSKEFYYRTSLEESSQSFIYYQLTTDDYAELHLTFLDSHFDLIDSKCEKMPNYSYKNTILKDVFIPCKSGFEKDTTELVSKIWWSDSLGILKFTTSDGKSWDKIEL